MQVSDMICGPDCLPGIHDAARHALALKYALFIPTAVLVTGGLFFVLASFHVVQDKQRALVAAQRPAVPSSPSPSLPVRLLQKGTGRSPPSPLASSRPSTPLRPLWTQTLFSAGLGS